MPGFWEALASGFRAGGNVFINYRRDDTAGEAGRLFDRLAAHFPGRVFRDVSGIEGGANFAERIERELGACRVVLVLIGKRWLDCEDEDGNRRIEQPDDWVRQEIAQALQRGIFVMPVLVGGAQMPKASALPPDIARLTQFQAEILTDVYFDYNVQRIVELVEKHVGPAQRANARRGVPRWAWGAGIAAVVLFVLGLIGTLYEGQQVPPQQQLASYAQQAQQQMQPQAQPQSQQQAPAQAKSINFTLPEVDGNEPAPLQSRADPEGAITPDTVRIVATYIAIAAAANSDALRHGDANRAAFIFRGPALAQIQANITQARMQNLVTNSQMDLQRSYIRDLRLVRQGVLEVDYCAVWTLGFHNIWTGQLAGVDGPRQYPQTVVIQQAGSQWFVTDVRLHVPPGACGQ